MIKPLPIAIDDAFVSDHWLVWSWETVDTGLSDRHAVVADLALQPPPNPG